MTDRVCARGCTQRGIHFAACAGQFDEPPTCTGCAPRECRDGSLVCDTCFGRARRLLDDLPDLIARLRSLADPSKATPTDQPPRGRGQQSEAPAPVGSDLLDAIIACELVWSHWVAWGEDLQVMSNRVDAMHVFGWLLDRHKPVDGIRPWWSVQDAVDQWGVERRPGKHERPWSPDPNSEEVASWPVREWGRDQLVSRRDAWRLAESERTFQRWVQQELIEPAAQITVAGVRTVLYRTSDVVRIREEKSNA